MERAHPRGHHPAGPRQAQRRRHTATLADQVRKDVAETKPYPADTYFGGKALYRSAQLYQLATQLGLEDVAASVKATLVEQLDQWTDPQGCAKRPAFCFVYDPQGKGMIGQTASFGSDEYNDHHFHYGYFLYTAGLLAGSDPALATKWQPVMDLVAADIAGTGTNGLFPDRRPFDAYNAHSWASGTSPFGDGNNQESTSEAVTAWTGLSLWADATRNQPLQGRGHLDARRRAVDRAALRPAARHERPGLPGLRPPGRLAELGWQAGLRDVVLAVAGGDAGDPACCPRARAPPHTSPATRTGSAPR